MTRPLATDNVVPKVLIADDDPSVVRFLAERCTKMGFEVQTATSGLQALVMARRSPPDVMIVDVNMPELDGLSLSLHLLDSRGNPLELIVVTGKPSNEIADRCDSFGATYVSKGPRFGNEVQSALASLFPDTRPLEGPGNTSLFRGEVRSKSRILIVDDDPAVESFLKSRFIKCGIEPLFAVDAISGFRAALREKPSIILSEYKMIKGSVNYLLWRLRSNRETERIPLFIATGCLIDEATEELLKRDVCGKPGALRVFRKPIDVSEVFLALKEHCDLNYELK